MAQTVELVDEYNLRRPQFVLHDTEQPTFQARLAINLVERWGMVAGDDGGEDSQGRAKLRLQTPQDVVTRACETAELLTAEIRRRNWFTPVPPWDEIAKQTQALRKKREEEEDADLIERSVRRAEKQR